MFHRLPAYEQVALRSALTKFAGMHVLGPALSLAPMCALSAFIAQPIGRWTGSANRAQPAHCGFFIENVRKKGQSVI